VSADLNDFQCRHCLARYAKVVNAGTAMCENQDINEYKET